jgi:heme-degrading monooxygenase HmoA
MIERHWTALAKKEKANDYIFHLQNRTFAKLKKIEGFIQSKILLREVSEGIEFLIVTVWDNFDAIRKFTGEEIDTAVVPDVVHNMIIRFDSEVKHFEVRC